MFIEEYLTGLCDRNYPTKQAGLDAIEINSIQLMAYSSDPRQVVVPINIKRSAIKVQTMAFLDIESMTKFVDNFFAKENGLKLEKHEFLLGCEAWHRVAGPVVEWEWDEELKEVGTNGLTKSYTFFFWNLTCLGQHETMIGLQWMEEVGCFSKLIKGGSYLVLGKELLIASIVLDHKLNKPLDCKHISSDKFGSSPSLSLTALVLN